MDLKKYVNCDLLSDIKFIVEGRPVFAHKVNERSYNFVGMNTISCLYL